MSPDELSQLIERAVTKVLSIAPPKAPATSSGRKPATRKQAADYLGISLPTLLDHTNSGKIKGNRLGRRVYYRWEDLDAALVTIKAIA